MRLLAAPSGGRFTRRPAVAGTCLVVGMLALAAGCGSSDPPAAPTPGGGGPGGDGGGGSAPEPTITITASGVDPKALTVAVGARVRFTNNDAIAHEMNSNPHPTHGSCPAIDQVGFLAPGQSKLSGNLTPAGTCGYHDHNRDTDTSLQGTITIQ